MNDWCWLRGAMSLFLLTSVGMKHLPLVSVSAIEWKDGSQIVGSCRYCKGRNTTDALKCVHCGAAIDSENIGALVDLCAKLPGGRPALDLERGDILEITHRQCGLREEYVLDEVVIRLTVRKIVLKAFKHLVIFDPSMQEEVEAEVTIACEMELTDTGEWLS